MNCPNCGKPGAHFVPPSCGEPGFFICDMKTIHEPAPSAATETLSASRRYRIEHKEEIRQWQKRHNAAIQADPVLRQKKLEANRRSRKKMAEKHKQYDRDRDRKKLRARGMVRNHIWRGTMKRGVCEICSSPNTHAHHDDYDKPLEVRWFCPKHHKEIHHV